MSPFRFLLAALASYRLFRLAAQDDVLQPMRRLAMDRLEHVWYEKDDPHGFEHGWCPAKPEVAVWKQYVAKLLTCHWCLGSWIAFAVFRKLATSRPGDRTDRWLHALAGSAVVGFVGEKI